MEPEAMLSYMEDVWERQYHEYIDAFWGEGRPVSPSPQTTENTDEEDEDNALIRLGINTPTPQRETILAFQGSDVHATTITSALDAIGTMGQNFTGGLQVNGEDIEALIRRIVREELNQRREEQ